MSIVTIALTMIVSNLLIPYTHAAVGEKKQKLTSRSEMAPMGDYLYVAETSYLSTTPAFFTVKTTNELECKCTCSSHKQCLSVTYRRSDGYCSLYANDPCDTRMWQSNANMHFYIHIKRLKYRLYDPPKQNEPLKRLSISSLCGDMTGFDADQRWLFVMKLSGRSKVSFNASNFDQAPNQVAPSPWSTTPIETMWSSTLMQQWYSSVQIPGRKNIFFLLGMLACTFRSILDWLWYSTESFGNSFTFDCIKPPSPISSTNSIHLSPSVGIWRIAELIWTIH